MSSQIDFAIPGMCNFFDINKHFINIRKEYPEYFYSNINIAAVYGNFEYCIWNGGRIFKKVNYTPLEEVLEIQTFYNENNIPIRFIYTNNQLQKEHLQDKYSNIITKLCQNNINEIVVNSTLLEEYLKEQYPKYKFISSTTKCLDNINDLLQELNQDYYRVCLDYNLNNEKILQQIPEKFRSKCEILVNENCPLNCSYRKTHYNLVSHYVLHYNSLLDIPKKCFLLEEDYYGGRKFTINDIFNFNNFFNISHFKIQGRTASKEGYIMDLIKYFVKPEYQLFIIYKLLERGVME